MKILPFLIVVIVCASCITLDIVGRTNDYDKLTESQQKTIIPYSKATSFETGNIYTFNGQELRKELEKHPKSLVYVFTNGCSGDLCLPMAVYENYAKTHNQKLFLVMNGFGSINSTIDQPIEGPLYAIDGDYYQEKIRAKYGRKFGNDLRNVPLDTSWKDYEIDGNLYFFSGNNLDSVCKKLPENMLVAPQFH